MQALLDLIKDHYRANERDIDGEIEMRHGVLLTEDAPLKIQVFSLHGEGYALAKLDDTAVAFITVNWGEPSVKFTWL